MYRIGEVVVDAVSKTDHVPPPPAGGRQPKPQGRGEYSRTLERLARFTLRHKLAVVGAWIAAAAALAILFPQLEAVVREQSLDPLPPRDVASFQSLDRMGEAFDEKGATNSVFVTMENPAGLSETVRDRYETMVDRLRSDSEHVLSVRDLVGDPRTARQATSADGQAWYLPVGVAGTIGGTTSTLAIEAVREIAREAFDGTGTSVHVTGPPATFSDQITTAEADLTVITLATIALIVTILLIVYRSVFTALLPLIVVGMSLAVGRGLLSWFGQSGFPLSQFTIAFMTAILLGAGVDYSVFFISRFHERLRQGMDPDDAIVDAAASIGRVILASAATVALAFLAMLLAKLSAFASVGPACAVAVVVGGFAATVTLLPPLLSTAARRGIGLPPHRTHQEVLEQGGCVGDSQTGPPLFAVSMVALLALSAVAATMQVTYDDRAGQPAESDSNLGYALLDSHFPRDTVIAEFLLIQSPRDMRTARGLADLEQMATRVAQMPGVTRVVGITRRPAPVSNRPSCLAERSNRRRGAEVRRCRQFPTWPVGDPRRRGGRPTCGRSGTPRSADQRGPRTTRTVADPGAIHGFGSVTVRTVVVGAGRQRTRDRQPDAYEQLATVGSGKRRQRDHRTRACGAPNWTCLVRRCADVCPAPHPGKRSGAHTPQRALHRHGPARRRSSVRRHPRYLRSSADCRVRQIH